MFPAFACVLPLVRVALLVEGTTFPLIGAVFPLFGTAFLIWGKTRQSTEVATSAIRKQIPGS